MLDHIAIPVWNSLSSSVEGELPISFEYYHDYIYPLGLSRKYSLSNLSVVKSGRARSSSVISDEL